MANANGARVLAVPLLLAGAGVAFAVAACGTDPGSASAGTARHSATAIPGLIVQVAATSASDAWAVGGGGPAGGTLILRWNGTGWSRVPSPSPGPGGGYGSQLRSVAATSASDAWAVGFTEVGSTGKTSTEQETLIEHWNGTAWRQVPSPSSGDLRSVAATSASDAWAVGDSAFVRSDAAPYGPPLIEHWNGRAWTVTPSPEVAGGYLTGVAATSASDAWAVGDSSAGALIEHWDGKAWTRVSGPVIAGASLQGVAATSPADAWAVGYTGDSGSNTSKGLIEHWDGRAWKVMSSPGLAGGSLEGVAATSPAGAWAVGADRGGQRTETSGGVTSMTVSSKILIEHWDGKAWTRVSSPGWADSEASLTGVGATSASDAWAVGLRNASGSGWLTLIEHWDGTRWSAG